MRTCLRDRLRSESGANAVEFALLAPIVFMILFGTIYGGWAWNNQQTLTHAARDGARFAATLPGAPSATWESEVEERTKDAAHGLDRDDLTVEVVYNDDDPDDPRVTVHIETPFVATVPLLPAAWSGMTLGSNAVARYEATED